ncbi:mucin-20 [Nannospalax galili]|uniref:mucin-20 n=1 Tax=Nannospalax galili TaxID=1026970 RepID=UPI000819D3C5|nr:mucin-20 [Nannospalax galili]
MSSVWDLALALLFFCWEAGVSVNSTGLSTSRSIPLVTTNNTEVTALTQRVRLSSEGTFQTMDPAGYSALRHDPLETQTLNPKATSKTLILTSTISEVDSRDTWTTSPVTETKKTQTTCPSASTLETQTTFLAAVTMEPQSTLAAIETEKTQITFPATETTSPAASTLDPQTTSSSASILKLQTTSPAASTLETQTTSLEASTMEIQTTSPEALTVDTRTTFSAASTPGTQTTPSATSTLETQTISPEALTIEIQITSPEASTMDNQTPFSAASIQKFQTSSLASSTMELQTTLPEASSLKTHTTSPKASTMDTQTSFSAASILETHTTSPEASTMETQTTCPSALTVEIQTTSPVASTMDTRTPFSVVSTLDTQITSSAISTLESQTTFSLASALKLQSTSATKTRTLPKTIPSNLEVLHTTPMETYATSGSLGRTGVTTVETDVVSVPTEAIFDTLCTDDSSEEARKITTDLLTLAHTSTEAKSLSSESSSSSDSSVDVLTSSQAQEPDIATLAKDLVTFSITHIELSSCITEIRTSDIISGTSDTDHSPTGVALSTSETSALFNSIEGESNVPKTTTSTETLSTTSTSKSVILDTTLETKLPTSSNKERETTVPKTPIPTESLVTISRNPAFSIETQSHTEVLGTITIPTAAGSTVGEVTSFTASSVSVNSSSAVAATKNFIPSEIFTIGNKTNSSFPVGSSLSPFVYLTTASTRKKTNTRASPKTPMSPPTSTPTIAWTKKTTKATASGDGGFLLVRLSMASPEDLTETRVVERLMQQLRCELHTHMPLAQVSLLRVRRR